MVSKLTPGPVIVRASVIASSVPLREIVFAALKTVATVDVGPQAAGIDFWKMEPTKQ